MSLEKILSKVETAKKDSGRQNDKINVIVSDLKIEYGDLEWLTYNHVKKRKNTK